MYEIIMFQVEIFTFLAEVVGFVLLGIVGIFVFALVWKICIPSQPSYGESGYDASESERQRMYQRGNDAWQNQYYGKRK